MSKELIDSLRYLANRPPYSGAADIMLRAADALEAKAAPVGELSAGQEPVAWAFRYEDGSWHDISATHHSLGMTPLYTTPQPSSVPAGWKLVPVEPTPDMQQAALTSSRQSVSVGSARTLTDGCELWASAEVYKVMLAAAPSTPATVQGVNQQLLEALEDLEEAARQVMAGEMESSSIMAERMKARAAITAAWEGGKV